MEKKVFHKLLTSIMQQKLSRLSVIISLFIGGLSACQSTPPSKPKEIFKQNTLSKLTEIKSDEVIKTPFKIVNNHILIPVGINGSKPLMFVLDTGAPITAIAQNHNTRNLKLKLGQKVDVGGAGKGKSSKAYLLQKLNLQVGDIKIDDLIGLWLPTGIIPNFSKEEDMYFDGIIGYDLLRSYSVHINHDLGVIELYSKATSPRNISEWQKLPLQFENNHPYVNVAITSNDYDETDIKLLLDTGSTNSLNLSPDTHPNIEWPDQFYITKSKGLSGEEIDHNAPINQLNIANFRVYDFITSYSGGWDKASSQGILGNALLSHFNLWFDYQGKNLWLQKHNSYKPSLKADRSGIKILPTATQGARVINIYSDSMASLIGLEEGDLITSVSDMLINQDNFNQILDLFKSDARTVDVCWQPKSTLSQMKAQKCGALKLIPQ